MTKRTAYIGLGSNLGDRQAQLQQALYLLQTPELHVKRVSSVYESDPVGPLPNQPLFLNAVAEVQTELSARALLRHCLGIEHQLGRVRGVPMGPRTIDLDLLMLADEVLVTPELKLPHPELTRRAFVLVPLLELSPMHVDPRDYTLLCAHVGPLLRTQAILKVGPLPRPPILTEALLSASVGLAAPRLAAAGK